MTADHIDIAARGEQVTLPLVDILTGRGFVTGKSGSGKSTTVSVVVEEILDLDQPLLIVDTDGEYWGLKEHYQVLHLGNGDQCDVRVTATDAETVVDLALVEQVPIVLDISGFMHTEDAQEILNRVVRELFHREKVLKEPFLLVVEEVHEYIPESGALTEAGETLIQVAKRGRKHGLGFCGVSQRPASVDKDFITQCDWLVWHRLTWKNDTEVVRTILGSDASETVQDLDQGEALLLTDWDEQLRQVQVRQKRTFDAGATPGFEDFQPPELVPVNPAVLNRFDERRLNVDYGDMDDPTLPEDDPEPGGEGADDGEPSAGEEAEPDADLRIPELTEEGSAATTAERSGEAPPPESVDAEVVARTDAREQPARTAERKPRRGTSRPKTTPPTTTSEGAVVEFAQLLLFLAGRVRVALGRLLLGGADAVGRWVRWVDRRRPRTREEFLVAGWLALVVLFVLLLATALAALLQ